MKKQVSIKDVDVTDVTEQEKKDKKRKIKIISLIILVSLFGLLFLSTYLRWNADIADKHKIIYYKQDGLKINSLVDFYGGDVNLEISDDDAIVMYCSKDYGQNCITADYLSPMENIFRNPVIIINIVIIIDLILFYNLIKGKYMKDIYKVIMGLVILIYGLGLSFMQLYKVAEYYIFANNQFSVNAVIFKGVITDNDKKFNPIVKYEIDGKEYIEYLDTEVKGKVSDKIGEEINIHYYKKDKSNIVGKRNVLWRIAPFILGIIIIVEATYFFPKYRKIVEDKKEQKEEIKS